MIFHNYKFNIYSQNGEDGIIAECLSRMGITKGYCCEFGASDGRYCSNTYYLIEQGWKGLMIEPAFADFKKLQQNTKGLDVKLRNVPVDIFTVHEIITRNNDVLSIDIDGNDYDVWRAMKTKDKIVVIEINSGIDPMAWNVCNQGTSYLPMVRLGWSKGYFLLCHTGNLVFIKNEYRELFPECKECPVENYKLYFDRSWQ